MLHPLVSVNFKGNLRTYEDCLCIFKVGADKLASM